MKLESLELDEICVLREDPEICYSDYCISNSGDSNRSSLIILTDLSTIRSVRKAR